MLSRRLSCIVAVVAGGLVLGARPAVSGAGSQGVVKGFGDVPPLQIVRQSVQMDPAEGSASFDLQFNRKPDFYTIDSAGRPADSFQYEVNPNWSGNPQDLQLAFGQFRDVIRGDEIHTSGKLVIRDATPAAHPEPNSGGWGSVVATIPFHVSGDDVTFSVPMHDLRTKGPFSYNVFTTNFGATTADVQSQSRAVPLPPGAWAGLSTLGGLALAGGVRRLRARADSR